VSSQLLLGANKVVNAHPGANKVLNEHWLRSVCLYCETVSEKMDSAKFSFRVVLSAKYHADVYCNSMLILSIRRVKLFPHHRVIKPRTNM
jgi:hypothetical protein